MASKGTLKIRIVGDAGPLEKSLDKATGALGSFAKGATAVFAGLGVTAGAVFVSEFGDAMERGRLEDRLGAQLGLTEDQAKRAGKVAGDLYINAYGESLEQVHDAVGAVLSTLGDELDDEALSSLTAHALDLSAAFDTDVNSAVTAAGVLMRQGLAKDGEQAFDLIVKAMQEVPAEMRDELLPIIEEYSQDFAALGISGEDTFALLVEASRDGRFELDKTGDAIKELTIRASDMSKASQDAFETIGLDAAEMSRKIVTGGQDAREAFDQIIDGLLDIEDPADRANTAIALFGTPLEDLSVTEIPAFLERLDEMDTGFEDVQGAADRMGDSLNDNAATKIESFKRRASEAISSWVYENVLPGAEQVIAAFEEDGVGGALAKAIELWEQAQPKVQAWFNGTLKPFFEQTVVPWAKYIGGEIGTQIVNGIVEILAHALPAALEGVINSVNFVLETIINGINSALEDVLFLGGVNFGDVDFGNVNLPSLPAPNFTNPVERPGQNPGFDSSGPGGRIMHTGGMVAASFPRTPGLRHDERHIIAQTGEEVRSRSQVSATARLEQSLMSLVSELRGRTSAPNYTVNITNPEREPASTSFAREMRRAALVTSY